MLVQKIRAFAKVNLSYLMRKDKEIFFNKFFVNAKKRIKLEIMADDFDKYIWIIGRHKIKSCWEIDIISIDS